MNGYVKANGIEPKARIIVNKLKLIKTKKARIHNVTEYNIPSFIDILPEAIGRFFVRKTRESNSLSKISLTIHPADLINNEPRKNKIK